MGYCVVSPNTITGPKGTITAKTVFKTLEEAKAHKEKCDEFDDLSKRPRRSYIIEVNEDEPSHTIIINKYIEI